MHGQLKNRSKNSSCTSRLAVATKTIVCSCPGFSFDLPLAILVRPAVPKTSEKLLQDVLNPFLRFFRAAYPSVAFGGPPFAPTSIQPEIVLDPDPGHHPVQAERLTMPRRLSRDASHDERKPKGQRLERY